MIGLAISVMLELMILAVRLMIMLATVVVAATIAGIAWVAQELNGR